MKNGKKGSQSWLRFSLLMALLKKMREVFVINLVMEKNLSWFIKIHFLSPGIDFIRRHTEQEKMGDFFKKYWRKWFFFREGGITDPL
jgi:hypothetical protein